MITLTLKNEIAKDPRKIILRDSVKKIGWLKKFLGKQVEGPAGQKIDGYWATIERQDRQAFTFYGDLICSDADDKELTEHSNELAAQILKDNKKAAPFEHVINFDKVVFGSVAAERDLRLTVELRRKQMAIAYCQLYGGDGKPVTGKDVQYLFPEKTSDNIRRYFDLHLPSADTYPPDQHIRVKILYFETGDLQGEELIRRADQPYEVLIWENKRFRKVDGPQEVKRDKKTLILFHGTFVDCNVSYSGLMTPKKWDGVNDSIWLDDMKTLGYEQIIGFNHPSVIDSPQVNAQKFRELMGLATGSQKFSKPVDIITTSRGGLVGKAVCLDAELNSKDGLMEIEKVATVACANGCGWITLADNHPKFFHYLLMPFIKFIPEQRNRIMAMVLGIMQMEVKKFLEMDGMRAMKPGDPLLTAIAAAEPPNRQTRYLPICGDDKAPPKPILDIIYLIADKALDKNNDLVIGTHEQVIMPKNFYAYKKDAQYYFDKKVDCSHLGYFKFDIPQAKAQREALPGVRIKNFLADTSDAWRNG